MSTPPELAGLAEALDADAARDVPPFGAASVRRARELGAAAGPMLAARAQAGGQGALLALEALRAADPATYAALPGPRRAQLYVAALAGSTFFNAWGQPGSSWTDTARALAALGPDAVSALAPLLADTREAPSAGSQDATLSRMRGHRICDYAWALIHEARGEAYVYGDTPADRDPDLATLRASLGTP